MNMRHYVFDGYRDNGYYHEEYILGSANFIERLYRRMMKRFERELSSVAPAFNSFPKFAPYKLYAICIEDGYFEVINSDTFLRIAMEEGVV